MEHCLITGATGQLGAWLLKRLAADTKTPTALGLTRRPDRELFGFSLATVDLADPAALRATCAEFRPTHVIHSGAMTSTADCYCDPPLAGRINTDATAALADAATECGARFVFISTDMVFGGDQAPYSESDPTAPLSVYGRTKVAAELALAKRPRCAVVRLPLMVGFPATPRTTTFANQVHALREGKPLRLFADEFRTPIALQDAAAAVIAVARSDFAGTLHVAGPERLSRLEMGQRFAAALGIKTANIEPVSRRSINDPEPRPEDLSLNCKEFLAYFPKLAARPIGREALSAD